MQDLKVLDLTGCSGLTSLPDDTLDFTQLKELILKDCSELCRLPASNNPEPRLVVLNLQGCSKLQNLPAVIGKASKLEQLNLSGCERLEEVPQCMHKLQPRRFYVTGCTSLKVWDMLQQEAKWEDKQETQATKLLQRLLKLQLQYSTVRKLAREQSTMLTSLERMSWVVVLLATATFIGFLQPPGGYAVYDKQVMAGNFSMCSSAPAPDGYGADNIPQGRLCALLLFFVFDAFSFSCSLGCLVMIVVLSMPRPFTYDSDDLEAGRFWWLLLLTWGLLYLAVAFGFGAFVSSAWGTYASFSPWLVVAVLPGFVLLLFGGVLMVWRFIAMSPGWKALLQSVPLMCCSGCCGCFGLCGSSCFQESDTAVRLDEDIEVGRAPATDVFWQNVGHQLQEGSSRARGSMSHLLRSGELLQHLRTLVRTAVPSVSQHVPGMAGAAGDAVPEQIQLLQRRPSRSRGRAAHVGSDASSSLGPGNLGSLPEEP
jgi:hypothetical protein